MIEWTKEALDLMEQRDKEIAYRSKVTSMQDLSVSNSRLNVLNRKLGITGTKLPETRRVKFIDFARGRLD